MSQPFVAEMIELWSPDGRVICANCLHAKVNGEPADPKVRCAAGHGKPGIDLSRLIRSSQPRGLAYGAGECDDFERSGWLER